jgi:hypothetical protein
MSRQFIDIVWLRQIFLREHVRPRIEIMKFLAVKGIELSKDSGKLDKVDRQSDVCCYHIDRNRDEELGFPLSQYNLNYIFDKQDHRDYKFSSTLLKDIDPNALPSKVDMRPIWGDILDQGSLGSCVSNSVAYQLRFLIKKDPNNNTWIDMSRLFIYYNGRVLFNFSVTEDTGLTMREGFQSVTAKGCVDETTWPYVVSKFSEKAPDSAYTKANNNKGLVYLSVAQDVNEIKKCLKDGYAVSFGISLYESFMSTQVARTGIVPTPDQNTEQRVGGHAMTIVGYDDSTQCFIVANQWGKAWGDSGFCHMPYSMIIDTKTTGDLWTPRSYKYSGASQPIPTPTPAPKPSPSASAWAPNINYKKGDTVTYLGHTFQCVISHKSMSVWNPNAVPALWKRIN